MRKRYLLFFAIFVIMSILTSCTMNTTDVQDNDINIRTEEINETQNKIYVEVSEDAVGGGDYPCNVHHTVYHMIPSEIIELVGGNEAIEEWITNNTSGDTTDSECPMLSIKQVIDAFDITEDEFAEACNLVFYPYYDLDVLFNGSIEEADVFYRDMEWVDYIGTVTDNYLDLREAVEKEYSDVIKEKNIDIYANSIPELVTTLGIKREMLEKIIKEVSVKRGDSILDYNLDMLYGTNQIQEGVMSITPQGELGILSVNEDDDPANDISSNELDEMFCRVGRYAE